MRVILTTYITPESPSSKYSIATFSMPKNLQGKPWFLDDFQPGNHDHKSSDTFFFDLVYIRPITYPRLPASSIEVGNSICLQLG